MFVEIFFICSFRGYDLTTPQSITEELVTEEYVWTDLSKRRISIGRVAVDSTTIKARRGERWLDPT
ncbi:MAG: hypothetical protein QW118_04235 [Nitrososphaerota archaeon]